MKKELREEGSASVQIFVLLLFLSVLLSGGVVMYMFSAQQIRRAVNRGYLEQLLLEETGNVITAIISDPTPFSDSPADPVMAFMKSGGTDVVSEKGVTLVCRDISSAINPNLAFRNLFEKTDLKSFFLPGKDENGLQMYREERGFHLDLMKGYADFFTEKALEKFLTPYSWADINTTDEFSLRKIVLMRTGSEAEADALRSRVQLARTQKKVVSASDLKDMLGASFDAVYPVIFAGPSLNVHFLDIEILVEIMKYPDYNITNADSKIDMIRQRTRNGEIRKEDLKSIIGKEEPHTIYSYLGTTTWFWEITAEKNGVKLVTILSRIPEDPDRQNRSESKPVFSIVERRITS